ncbi:MAG TPA: 16S rRNA (cytidine(1402)-2'-O)-methyltransferase [Burkholderiaceae bacterium]|nr:16S rRNA (cytidine(1402)-2'-O)-methyltransferase [Burkholderiaceae bacterium]
MSFSDPDDAGPGKDGLTPGLYVVATPIGRLSDLGRRAEDVLRRVDVVAAEDTRTSRVLLDHVGARPTLVASHEHNEASVAPSLVAHVRAGRSVALVSDAGTPGISDPGARVVAAMHAAGLPVVPVPGPAAVTALLSAAGFLEPRFRFEGFLPTRPKARRERLARLARSDAVVVLYESPHRIEETVDDLCAALEPGRAVVIGRELTKRFEQLHRGTAGELPGWLRGDPDRRRGEFVIAFDAAPPETSGEDEADALLAALCEELPVRQAARIAAKATGRRANDLYRRALALRPRGADDAEGADDGAGPDADGTADGARASDEDADRADGDAPPDGNAPPDVAR